MKPILLSALWFSLAAQASSSEEFVAELFKIEESIKARDKNNDGRLDKDEYTVWNRNRRALLDQDQVKLLDPTEAAFETSDGDRDGRLTIQQVLEHETSWVSTEGKNLRGILLGPGEKADVVVLGSDGTRSNLPLERLDAACQKRAWATALKIQNDENNLWSDRPGFESSESAFLKEQARILEEDSERLFSRYRLLLAGPNLEQRHDSPRPPITRTKYDRWMSHVMFVVDNYPHLTEAHRFYEDAPNSLPGGNLDDWEETKLLGEYQLELYRALNRKWKEIVQRKGNSNLLICTNALRFAGAFRINGIKRSEVSPDEELVALASARGSALDPEFPSLVHAKALVRDRVK